MPDTISNVVLKAFEKTLQEYLRDYLSDKELRGLNFFYEPEEIKGSMCPAIGVFGDGGTEEERTLQGIDGDGRVQPGWVFTRYKVDLQIFVKGQSGFGGGGFHRDDSLLVANRWRDAVKACLEEHWDLGGLAVDVEIRADEPIMAFREQSVVLRACVVRAEVLAFRQLGSIRLEVKSNE